MVHLTHLLQQIDHLRDVLFFGKTDVHGQFSLFLDWEMGIYKRYEIQDTRYKIFLK